LKKLFFFLLLLTLNFQLLASVLITNGLTHVHNTQTGGQVTGKVIVRNESKKEARIVIYQQDLVSTCGSSIEYRAINQHNRSLGNWLKTNVDERLLSPNEEYTIHYSISIPKEQVENGTYWAVLMVEGADPIKEEQANGMQVNSKVRYAVQVLADVGAVQSPELTFENVKLEGDKSADKSLKIKLKNAGLYSTRAKLALEVYGEKGEKIKTFEALQRRIYPNFCNDFEIVLKDLPKGKYEAVLVADNGKDMFGSNMTLDIE
jgi:hypothetical protein